MTTPLFVLALTAATAFADSDCLGRPATAAEEAAHQSIMTAFKNAAAPPPKSWEIAQESPIEKLVTACKGAEANPTKYDFGRAYSNAAAISGRQDGVNEKMQGAIKDQEKLAASNAGKIAALDKKSEDLQKRMEKAAAASNVAELEKLGKEMGALYELRAKLESGDTGARSDAIEKDAVRDTTADISITANLESVILSEFKPLKLADASMAFRQHLVEGENPEDAIYVLLGPWKLTDDGATAEPAAALPGKKHTAVHTIAVRVKGAPQTALGLVGKTKLAALKALIAR